MEKDECTPLLRLDDLQYKGLELWQYPSLYCFTSDAVLLANLAKVKKARQEIIMLDNRERSASVIETMAQTEKDNMEVSPENIKAAIVAEISSLPTSVPIFTMLRSDMNRSLLLLCKIENTKNS